MQKQKYLNYIKKAVIEGRNQYDMNNDNWKQSFDPNNHFGYVPPNHVPTQAYIEGFMYSLTKEEDHAIYAKKCLLDADDFKSIYPVEKIKNHPEYEKGLPSVESAFFLQPYMYSYLFVKESGVLTSEEKIKIENSIRSSIQPILHFPEWGAHNRSMLRVWSLTLAAITLGADKETMYWQKLADHLAEETIGHWSIEDAQLYIALWANANIHYINLKNKEEEYYSLPQTRYYFDYITKLITPNGQIPDFGDSHFNSNWYIWISILEKGASVYKCGHMKYAAEKIFEFAMSYSGDQYSPAIANHLCYAYISADDDVLPVRPDWRSEEVLEELIGKKMAFRNNQDSSSYLLLNYRDEGSYGYIPRKYLRTTLSVRAEKMHHGHGDENSVVYLSKDSNILLNDGGYRENLPNGKYRSEIYHNKMVFRHGIKDQDTSLYDFIHDEGYYKEVVTEKIHFQDFERACFSRTRLYHTDPELIWDRMITYLKPEDVFIVVDYIKSKTKGPVTAANLWHTGEVKGSAAQSSVFNTRIPKIYKGPGDTDPYINKSDLSLYIEFLLDSDSRRTECNNIKRSYGDSVLVSQYESSIYEYGENDCFVTILAPSDSYIKTASKFLSTISDNKDSLLLAYTGDDPLYLTYKLDLDKGISDDEDDYPRYSRESGNVTYGEIVTDADFSYIEIKSDKIDFGFINGCGIDHMGKTIFKTPDFTTYKFGTDISFRTNHKWKVWSGSQDK